MFIQMNGNTSQKTVVDVGYYIFVSPSELPLMSLIFLLLLSVLLMILFRENYFAITIIAFHLDCP